MSGNLYIYGKVGADVMPDTTGFRRELQAKLAAAMRGYEYELPISVDIDAMSYRAFKKKIENDELEQTIKLAYDASQVKKAMRDLGGKDLDELKIPLDADTRQFERETRRTVSQLEDSIEDALSRGFKLGTGNAQRALNDLKRRIEADKFEMTIDVQVDLDEAQRQLDRLGRDLKIADRFDRQADQLERRAKLMAARFPDFEIDVDIDKAVADLRRLSQQVKDGEDLSVTVRGKAELNLREANRELDRFKDKHDKLDMDVDVSTALASAHLAYFTRPRTVDIYANFKGTDLGKIINGITYGATGLEGVTNQFQKLVKLFDSLDDVVPKFSLIGAAAISLGAGLLNLGRSAGGVGVSLVSMSKAALAAPAALTGLAAAGYSAYAAYQVASKQFDVTATSLAGMTDAVGTAAWDEFGDELYRIANEIAPTLRDGLTGIATEEGKVAAGLLRVVEQSDKAGELANIFSRTQRMVAELNPGLQDLVKSFLDLGDETSEYLPRMGAYISDAAESMAHWVEQARQSGAITDAMEAAIEQGGYLKDSFKSLTGILSGTFGTLAQTENGIEGISEALAKADRAVNSVKFQETLESWSRGAQTAQDNMRDSLDDIGDALYSLRDEAEQVFGDAGAIVGSGIEGISRVLEQSGDGISDFSSGVRDGFEDVFDAVGDAGPMFDELLSMVGQLSKTFGGTFASGLRAAAPLITSIAKAAETAAIAFDSLPEPLKDAVTLYMTFGRAGKQALDSLKVGMLNNIQQTLQYQKTLQQVGVTAKTASIGFTDLLNAWGNMRSGNYATMFNGVNTAMSATSKTAETTGSKVSGLKGVFDSVKTSTVNAGNAILNAFGGPVGVAVGVGVGALIAAFTSYSTTVEASERGNESLVESLNAITSASDDVDESITRLNESIEANLTDKDYGRGENVTEWLNNLGNQFETTADAADYLGMSTEDLQRILNGGKPAYDAMISSFQKMNDSATDNYTNITKVRDATKRVTLSMATMRDEMLDTVKANAELNNVSPETIQKLYEQGESFDSLSIAAQSAEESNNMYLQSQEQLNDILDKAKNSQMNASRAANSYESQLDSMADVIKQVNELQQDGSAVWNEAANDFDHTTEAGRKASDAMTDLVDSANSYLEAMVSNGATLDDVTAKQSTMRDELVKQATAFTGSEDAAKAYVDSLLTTPSELETKINLEKQQAQSDLLDYINLVQVLFPDNGRTATRDLLIKGVVQGKLDVEKLQDIVNQLSDGKHVAYITADGETAVTTIENVKKGLVKLKDGVYVSKIDVENLAADKIDTTLGLYEKLKNQTAVNLLMNADGDALWKTENVEKNLKALGMSDKDITWFLNGEGTADERMAKVKELLDGLNLSDKQIEWILDCIDRASDKIDKTEKKKKTAEKPISFIIDADDTQAQVTMAGLESRPDIQKQMIVSGEPSNAQYVYGYMQSMADIIKWMYMYGNNDDAIAKAGAAKSAVEGIPTYWQSLLNALGNTSPFAQDADRKVRNVPTYWQSLLNASGNTASQAQNAADMIKRVPLSRHSSVTATVSGAGAVWNLVSAIGSVASKTVRIVANAIGFGHADGGRIIGPGTGTSDSIPAMLSNGEMVIRAASVRRLDSTYGKGWLDYLNRMGEIPNHRVSSTVERYRRDSYAYASGGRVRMPDMQTVSVKQPAQVVKSGPTYNTTQNIYYPAFAPTQITLNKKLDTAATYQL